MKKLLIISALTLMGSVAFAQESASISSSQLKSGRNSGVYEFKVPESITAEKVDAVKGYYKDYFTTSFDEATDILKLTLLKKDEMNIQVMQRILLALDLRTISVDGKEMTFQDMKDTYLK